MNIPHIITSSIAAEDWEPFVAGEVHMLRDDGEGKPSAGFWRVTPEQTRGPTEVPCHQNEIVYIIINRFVRPAAATIHQSAAVAA